VKIHPNGIETVNKRALLGSFIKNLIFKYLDYNPTGSTGYPASIRYHPYNKYIHKTGLDNIRIQNIRPNSTFDHDDLTMCVSFHKKEINTYEII